MPRLNYNLLFGWFVGLEMGDPVWDATVFSNNREQLVATEVSEQLLLSVPQVKLRGLKRVDWLFRFAAAAHNLLRLSKLIPLPATT
jgi:transposase